MTSLFDLHIYEVGPEREGSRPVGEDEGRRLGVPIVGRGGMRRE